MSAELYAYAGLGIGAGTVVIALTCVLIFIYCRYFRTRTKKKKNEDEEVIPLSDVTNPERDETYEKHHRSHDLPNFVEMGMLPVHKNQKHQTNEIKDSDTSRRAHQGKLHIKQVTFHPVGHKWIVATETST